MGDRLCFQGKRRSTFRHGLPTAGFVFASVWASTLLCAFLITWIVNPASHGRTALLASASILSLALAAGSAALYLAIGMRGASRRVAGSETAYAEAFMGVSPDLFVVLDGDGYVVAMNQAMRGILNVSETMGATPSLPRVLLPAFIPECHRDRFMENLREAAHTDETVSFECGVVNARGQAYHVTWHARRLHDGPQPGCMFVLAGIDITGHKKTQEELASSERRYRLYAENVRDVLWVLDRDLNYVYISPSVYLLRGYTPEEAMRMPIDQVFTKDSLRKIIKLTSSVKSLLAKGERIDPQNTLKMELEQFCKDGSTKWTEVIANILLDDEGNHVGFLGITRDITDRKLAQESLRLSEERYRTIFETTGNAMAIVRHDDVISLANGEFERLSGYFRHDIEGKMSWTDFIDVQDRDRVAKSTPSGANDQASTRCNYDFRFVDRWGRTHMVTASSTLIPGTSMRVVSLLDITDMIEAQERLKASREQLRKLHIHTQELRERERANVAREIHDELGQVLTALKMDLSYLARRLHPDLEHLHAKISSMSRSIDASIDSVRRIIMELRPGLLDHLGLVPAIEWQIGEFERRTGIACTLSVSHTDIDIDREVATTVFRILQEALTNVARHAEATEVSVSMSIDQNTLILTINDNGRGITQNEIEDPTSFGLMGMKERALFCSGAFEISAGRHGKGTQVTLRVPLSKTGKDHDTGVGGG